MKRLLNIFKLLALTTILVSCSSSDEGDAASGIIQQDPFKISTITLSVTGGTTISADGVATTTLQALAVNSQAAPLSGKLISLTIPTDGGSVITDLVATNSSGIATFELTSSMVPGVYAYRVSSESHNSNYVSVTFSGEPVDSVTLSLTGASPIEADGVATTTLEALVLDISANPLEGRSVVLNIPTDGGTTTSPAITNASGIATFSLTSSLVAGTYSFTATSESINSNSVDVDFAVTPVNSVLLAVTGSTAILADGITTTTLEATVLDASLNPLSGRSVVLNIPTDGGTTTSPATSDASGIATFTLTSSIVAGTYSYTATSETINSTSTDVTFTPAISSITLAVTGATSIIADGVATTTLEATALDASLNPIPGKDITLNIQANGGTTTNPVTTNGSGVASFTLTSSLVPGVYSYTATGESINSTAQNVTFTQMPVDSVTLAVTGAASIAADGVATTTFQATVLDANSNPLAGKNVTLNIPANGGTTTNPAVTDASGIATFTLTSSLVAGGYSYTATSDAVNSNTDSVTFIAPVATVNLVVTGATDITADGVTTTTLEATVLDGSANPLSGRSVTLNIPTDGGTTTNPATTNGSGVATFTLTSSTVVGVYSYTATSESINSTSQNVTFSLVPVDSVSLAVTGATSITADGVATTTLEATVLDASLNPLSGRSVTLNIPTDGGTTTNPATTNGSGVASFTLTSSLVDGIYSYTATSEAVNSTSQNITFTPIPVNSVSLAVTGAFAIVGDGVTTTTLEATVLDASLNPLPGRDVTLNIPANGGTTTNPATTNGSGVATFTLTSSTTFGSYSYTATSESVNSNSDTVDFVAPVSSVSFSVIGSINIMADGVASTTLEATVLDASLNPLPGRSVTLNIPTNGGTVLSNPVVTNGSGVATFTLTSSTTAGLYSYTATCEGVNSPSDDVTFLAPIGAVTLSITGATTILADGTSTTTLEALVQDGSSNPLSGRSVTLNIPANGGTTTNPATTNGSGIATFTLTSSTTAGLYSYTATSESVNSNSQNVTFDAPIATITLSVTGATTIAADGVATTTLEALVQDAGANPLSGKSIALNIPANGGSTTTPSTTNGSGIATFTLTSSTTAGTYSYTATGESINSGSQNVTFAVPVATVTLTVTGSTTILADGVTTTTLEALVQDASLNPLSGRNVTLNIPANGGTTTNPATTNGSGIATFVLTSSSTAGVYSYTATSEGINSTSQNVTFQAPVGSVTLSVTGATSISADGVQTTTLEALVRDASLNPLSGRSVTLNIPANGGTTVNPATTNGSGIATFTLTSSTTAGVYSYTATSEGVNSTSQNVTFVAPVATVILTVTGLTSIAADGIQTTTLEALVQDGSSNPLSGRSVTLNIPANGGTTTNPATTNGSGIATFTLTSSLVDGVYSYTATSEGVNSTSQNVTFTIPNAVLEWDVTTYDFGSVSTVVTQTFTLSNTGTSTTGTVSVTKQGSGKWAIVTDNCSGITLAPLATCTVTYEYDGSKNPKGTHSSDLKASATPGGTNITIVVTGTTI